MNLSELKERIVRWEDLHTDFRERFESNRELAKDLVCFANTDGGQLILGVAKDRSIVGVDDPDWLFNKVDDITFQHCEPPLTVIQEQLDVDGKKVVIVNIPKGDQRPYRTNAGRYYVRTTSGCRQASREELLRLFQATESLYEIEGFSPEKRPELPEEALREAMINAVAHRDYTTHRPIRLFILDDRIEIHTPGKAPNTVDEDAMRAGIHVVRNPHIYGRLSDAGLVTRAGSGIRRMIRLIKEATGNDISIDLRNFEVLITIPRKKRTE